MVDVVDFTDALTCPTCGEQGYLRAYPDGTMFIVMRCRCKNDPESPLSEEDVDGSDSDDSKRVRPRRDDPDYAPSAGG
jgi:hypothetical protein